MSEQVGSTALGVPFRSQIAVSVSQNVRSFLGTLGFRYVLRLSCPATAFVVSHLMDSLLFV